LVSVDFRVTVGWKRKSHRIHDSNTQGPHGRHQLTRVNSTNVLDEGLRIGGKRRRMNLKVKIYQTRRGLVCIENKRGTQLAQSQSVLGRPLPTPIYRWQVSRIRSGSIQITLSVYDIISYFDYIYAWTYLTGLRGTKITGFISYALVNDELC
jgi:hypothetical protein